MERGENFDFFSKILEFFIFEVFGHFQVPDVKFRTSRKWTILSALVAMESCLNRHFQWGEAGK